MREHAPVGMLEAELEDAVVGDREREREREPPTSGARGSSTRRLPPRQLAEDPRRAEELEAREHDSRRREARLQVHGVAEEEAEVALSSAAGAARAARR